MNKSALRNFAIEARKELRDKVKMKAMQLGITEENIKKETVQSSDAVFIEGRQLTIEEQSQRNRLIEEIKKKGYNQVIEEVAYTWFNRFTALRFMEVNKYLPTKIRVLSSENEGSYEPDIIREALNIDLDVDKELVYKLRTSKDNDAIDKLYKYLILLQCDKLSIILPFLFGKTNDYTKLLFPDGLLQNNFLKGLANLDSIPEEDWKEVEIIGWLYQYYIAEENERVIQAKKRYKKEEIPFATQLFTPDWIVKYMVQNALGRYWVESHPEHKSIIKDWNWEYYLENPNPDPDFEEKLEPYLNKEMKVEEIKCFDPAMGSGHILVYMFDVLYQIYSECGYMERDIPKLIIENNLYGLEIDDRAYQLACFAVIMKAQQYNSRFLRNLESQVRKTGEYIKLNLASIQETNHFNIKDIEYLAGEAEGKNFEKVKAFIEQFRDAKIYGSLTEIVEFDEEFLNKRANSILNNPVADLEYQESKDKVDNIILELIKQTKIMNEIYDVLVTNPPYIGSAYLNPTLNEMINNSYEDYKQDLFSVFMAYSFNKVEKQGQLGFMTPYVWMFIKSYEALRTYLIEHKTISSLIQLEYSGFDGATVPVCTFTMRNSFLNINGEYIKLSDFKGADNQSLKTKMAIINPYTDYRYSSKAEKFTKIPGRTITYWASDLITSRYGLNTIKQVCEYSGAQNKTADNNKYIRKYWEVSSNKKYWVKLAKGGAYRKWYGNLEDIIDWSEEAKYFYKNNKTSCIMQEEYLFRQGVTWTKISSIDKASFRYIDELILYETASPTLHITNNIYYYMGLLNSIVGETYVKITKQTLNFQVNDIINVPRIFDNTQNDNIEKHVKENISISKNDWDSFETSWDFKKHPLLQFTVYNAQCTIENAFEEWKEFTKSQFNQLKANEEELNSIFIEIYGLQDELTPEVEDKDITITKVVDEKSEEDKKNSYTIDRKQAIESFLSYAVGCIFGRYSLDEEGLIYAGGDFKDKFKIENGELRINTSKCWGESSIDVTMDNIIPITDPQYYPEDIVTRFMDFVKVSFGGENLNENLKFIAESIGARGNELPRETIRRYFLNDFYKNHVQTYKKRPIYWLFTSGKEKAFNALIYMHRYDSTTLARIRTDYLHVLQSRFDAEKQTLIEKIKDADTTPKEKRGYEKELKDLEKKIAELKAYDEVLHHMADKMIEIDLDDGVKVNYEIFEGLVQKI